jgi:hypothetical protein
MDGLVIPNIQNQYERERAIDETPQSGLGPDYYDHRTKICANEAVTVTMDNNAIMNVRLVDCVGYLVKSAWAIWRMSYPHGSPHHGLNTRFHSRKQLRLAHEK